MKIKTVTVALLTSALFCMAQADDYHKSSIELITGAGYRILADVITLAEKPGPGVLAVHMLGGDRKDWEPLWDYLARTDIAKVLAIDIRGHGGSVLRYHDPGKAPDTIDYRCFKKADYVDATKDVAYAFNYLKTLAGVDSSRCGIIGASIGANYALKVALSHQNCGFLVLISPGLVYRGLVINKDIKSIKEIPLLIVASSNIEADRNSARWLWRNCSSKKKKIKIFDDGGHGTDIIKNQPASGEYIAEWLKAVLK